MNKVFRTFLRKTLLLAATILLHGFVFAASAAAQSSPVSQSDYWSQVQQTLKVVTSLEGADATDVRSALDAEAQLFSSMTAISLPDGTTVPQDNSYIVGLLKEDPPKLDVIATYLTLLLATQSPSPDSPTQAGKTSETIGSGPSASEILARPEFNWEEEKPNPLQEWLDKMYARVLDFISDMFPGVQAPSTMRPLITIIGALLLFLILGYALRSFVFDMVTSAEAHIDEDEAGLILTAAGALQRAQDTAATGDYRTAVRYLYLSTLLQLEEHDLLRYDRTRTNREYLRSVAHLPQLATLLRDVVDVFDRVWYGYQTIDEASFQKYMARVTELRHFR